MYIGPYTVTRRGMYAWYHMTGFWNVGHNLGLFSDVWIFYRKGNQILFMLVIPNIHDNYNPKM